MKHRIVISPEADRDVDEHAKFIAQDSLEAALRLHDAVAEAFSKLAERPKLGQRMEFASPRLAELRHWPVRGFENYIIF